MFVIFVMSLVDVESEFAPVSFLSVNVVIERRVIILTWTWCGGWERVIMVIVLMIGR